MATITRTIHPVNRTTDRKARAHADKRLDKIEALEARLEIREWRS